MAVTEPNTMFAGRIVARNDAELSHGSDRRLRAPVARATSATSHTTLQRLSRQRPVDERTADVMANGTMGTCFPNSFHVINNEAMGINSDIIAPTGLKPCWKVPQIVRIYAAGRDGLR
ncbi:hypothetical protein KGM_213833 [Danaus plexippus plexippus]|uniref:Uncharacterized protein n=1 Tax=Danaus plexippus plexippus TaxID=278856 RepID=A0A212FLB8_DANPL|nr:hypothetical protein KGM_213833 [Danaus plexippus plexippus]